MIKVAPLYYTGTDLSGGMKCSTRPQVLPGPSWRVQTSISEESEWMVIQMIIKQRLLVTDVTAALAAMPVLLLLLRTRSTLSSERRSRWRPPCLRLVQV